MLDARFSMFDPRCWILDPLPASRIEHRESSIEHRGSSLCLRG
ncbi:MAG: hypothetical protein AB1797_00520 [bacterium]